MNRHLATFLGFSLVLSLSSMQGCTKAETTTTEQNTITSPADALYNKGVTLTQLGKHAAAEDLYRKSLQFNPNNFAAYNNLGWSLAKQGKYAEAAAAFQKSLELKPDFDLAKNNLAWVNDELKKMKK